MCNSLFSKLMMNKVREKQQQQLSDVGISPDALSGGGGTTAPRPAPETVTPTPTDTASTSPSGGSGLQTAQARIAGLEARDNAGLVAGEADVDVASDGDASELDPTTGRRRPTRASFMSQSRGGAGLKV